MFFRCEKAQATPYVCTASHKLRTPPTKKKTDKRIHELCSGLKIILFRRNLLPLELTLITYIILNDTN